MISQQRGLFISHVAHPMRSSRASSTDAGASADSAVVSSRDRASSVSGRASSVAEAAPGPPLLAPVWVVSVADALAMKELKPHQTSRLVVSRSTETTVLFLIGQSTQVHAHLVLGIAI